jgi:hypothetical protein
MAVEASTDPAAAQAGNGPARAVEPAAAAVVALAGMALTTGGVLAHLAVLIAPGSALTLLGGAWLGNVLARRDVRLIPTEPPREQHDGTGS